MSRYWVMAPREAPKKKNKKDVKNFDEIWKFNLKNGCISMYWRPALGDIFRMSNEELVIAYSKIYSDKKIKQQQSGVKTLSNFRQVGIGDYIIARKGKTFILAVGKVTKPAKYMRNGNGPAINHNGCLQVEWQDSPREIDSGGVFLPQHTIVDWSGKREFLAWINLAGSSSESSDDII